ncbi:hypothetical protein PTSG_08137 [Salpingoeca rosetta]|uniref:Uncharacterized protein n=1 Tax=Salpingoeca rosetta (strain ATCC 50818 / BSB-021) TaxID=946362 RepID=F2UI37_SALR5|nr:uncharacterized protein PTSG_08137 [Salpingoeca rosetta]EGD76786.1 hypothetical protein PTSG_08137 [Salpingoeca rosetta]|eukprot:XP_004991158.1 hypothetical protein PTSG_08137 [Salpingoeca rosetta]
MKIRRQIGEALLSELEDLHQELCLLTDIWRDYRATISTEEQSIEQEKTRSKQQQLPEPPNARARLEQEIRFFAECLRNRCGDSVTISTITEQADNLRQMVAEEIENMKLDVEFLRQCIDGEHEYRSQLLSRRQQESETVTLSELRDARAALEREYLQQAASRTANPADTHTMASKPPPLKAKRDLPAVRRPPTTAGQRRLPRPTTASLHTAAHAQRTIPPLPFPHHHGSQHHQQQQLQQQHQQQQQQLRLQRGDPTSTSTSTSTISSASARANGARRAPQPPPPPVDAKRNASGVASSPERQRPRLASASASARARRLLKSDSANRQLPMPPQPPSSSSSSSQHHRRRQPCPPPAAHTK